MAKTTAKTPTKPAKPRRAKPRASASLPVVAAPPPPKPATAIPPHEAPKPARPPEAPKAEPLKGVDFEKLANNVALMVQAGGKVAAAAMAPREDNGTRAVVADQMQAMTAALGKVADYYLADPARGLEAQTSLSGQFLQLWGHTMKRLSGEESAPVIEPESGDRRFNDPLWRESPLFDFIKEAYLMTSQWSEGLIDKADGLADSDKNRARFSLKQLTAAVSPTNFLATNPEVLRATLEENGDNLVRGLNMMAEDVERGGGSLRIRQTDSSKLKLGVDMATTPGKVVFRNELMELLQYAPSTGEVFKRPLLIVPPWINKFYVLDLNPDKSFVRWAVAQGFTVFVISWVNPDQRHAAKDFSAYMREGPLAALGAIEAATGEREVAAMGYCVGGTLLAVTLAHCAALGDKRITAATLLTTQVDFADAGDLKTFVDEARLATLEKSMEGVGYLQGSSMAQAFNMLRPAELIWGYFVSDYLKGKDPAPFDLLAWNSDSTRMPAANHAFYLRHCYVQNDLTAGRMEVDGVRLDLKKVTVPVYNLATREDHIAPAKSVFTGAKCFGGPMRYVLAGSGHIAGVVNPPAKPKYQFWSDGVFAGAFADWLASAKETPGSWWGDWAGWMQAQAPAKVAARVPGMGGLAALCDAPGEYVKVKA